MGANMGIVTSYRNEGLWLKGNLHTHTKNSACGFYPLEEVAGTYAANPMKYDFLAITDHESLTDVSSVQGLNDMIVFPGVEYKAIKYQTLGINISSYEDDNKNEENHQEIFDKVIAQGGINIICHPHLHIPDYWPLEKLFSLSGYMGIEIYNHNVKMNNAGRAVAVDVWDELLSRGKRVYGIASDDFHHRSRYGGAFLMVQASEKNASSILHALKKGSFYASTGILLKNISIGENNCITLENANEEVPDVVFRFVGYQGKTLAEMQGPKAAYTIKGTERYVRVEVSREDGSKAWTQPFFIE
ncbi:CehA/McbA family metallohydrolase [Treponema sp. OttesenSCG-928-L16]|nr:CehA/McbA family metallohydrolase [Treponema sp. OttesenSCG-928-L16]